MTWEKPALSSRAEQVVQNDKKGVNTVKLTKADIDKVRHIEGFPIAKDEDIIALSRPPYYTACPNPFIEDYIRVHGTPYDEATDDYHREPFAADVSEGKNDPIYNAHSYHTKVPYKAIMRYILHYTKPGDIVFDGFCGTGMTGVAAQMCGSPDPAFKAQLEMEMNDSNIEWGARKAILNDLSPAATFIAHNYNTPLDVDAFEKEAKRILSECEKELGWMYETQHVDEKGNPLLGLNGKPMIGRINYTVWSDVFVCPSCSGEINFWYAAVSRKTGQVNETFTCPSCGSSLKKKDCTNATITLFDHYLGHSVTQAKKVPVLVNYTIGKNKYSKVLDSSDLRTNAYIEATPIQDWIPNDRMPEGSESRRNDKFGIEYVHQFYTNRCLTVLGRLRNRFTISDYSNTLLILFTSQLVNLSKLNRYRPQVSFPYNPLSGTLYISSMISESNCFIAYNNKLSRFVEALRLIKQEQASISCQSATSLVNYPSESADYIFTDPPFGANLNYSELSFLWESWLKIKTNSEKEAIVAESQRKGIVEYTILMEQSLVEFHRILKPNRWMTVEFHNSKNSVWNSIQEAIMRAGFVVADVRTLDKQLGSFKQVTSSAAVKQDLVISAYKPKDSFVRDFQQRAGNPEMVWEFVRQHLERIPPTVDSNKDGLLEINAERCDYLLFDRMVAYHIIHGISVPMDAHTFYDGLRQRYLERDGMFFLPDQVTAYDEKRMHMELDTTHFSFAVTDEKNAIQWLNYILKDKPQTYSDIYPQFTRELQQDKREQMPELTDMLKDNFLQDEQGRFYIPDLSKAADLAKLRTKKLLKEFYDSYVPGKSKLKAFRMETIRAGFDDCWNKRDYKTIINVGERLPEEVLQEDPALLMYYDNACVRN